ncbi:uncharacterized protein A4U43_C06F6690 [Asparagus officinalis]|uniref:Uncharacterized protein n=1 Tax=Asparagus officinalis TaxID=4686 RepID=A0A5P1EMD4_ASPOF|nr:uncharacterized protein A4U43_C06F6690 [Asparagus officinalis]
MSNHDIVDITQDEQADVIRCYPKITVGLKFETELGTVDNQTMSNFRAMLRQTFRLSRSTIRSTSVSANNKKPRLLIISRRQSRAIANEPAIVAMARILGFDVAVGEDGAGSPGAGERGRRDGRGIRRRTDHMVYMPAGAVVVAGNTVGGLECWHVTGIRGPALGMGLRHLEYLINDEESTLIEEYKRDDPVIKDPKSVHKQGWEKLREVYLDKQNVRVNVGRMRGVLLEALKLLQKN